MSLTEAEIREKLGLKSHAEHEYDVFLNALPERAKTTCWTKEQLVRARYRGTGRTTEMIIQALGAVSYGFRVIITAYDYNAARYMLGTARRYADKLGLPPQNIRAEPRAQRATSPVQYTKHDGVVVYDDHYNGGEG